MFRVASESNGGLGQPQGDRWCQRRGRVLRCSRFVQHSVRRHPATPLFLINEPESAVIEWHITSRRYGREERFAQQLLLGSLICRQTHVGHRSADTWPIDAATCATLGERSRGALTRMRFNTPHNRNASLRGLALVRGALEPPHCDTAKLL